MDRAWLLVVALSTSISVPPMLLAQTNAEATSVTAPQSQHELQTLIKTAHTSAQYRQIANYYHHAESTYRAKAADEKIERDRRAQVNAGLVQKYPRPVDEAEYLYEKYSNDADNAALQAQHYDKLAGLQP